MANGLYSAETPQDTHELLVSKMHLRDLGKLGRSVNSKLGVQFCGPTPKNTYSAFNLTVLLKCP